MSEEEEKAIKVFKYIHIDRDRGTLGLCQLCYKMNKTENCQQCIEKAKEVLLDLIQKMGEKL